MDTKMRTLPDRPCAPRGILLVGINPPPPSVDKGHYYQGRHGRKVWARLSALGLLPNAVAGREDDAFVAAGNGLTDLVKRCTPKASDLTVQEQLEGAAVLRTKIRSWQPRLVLFSYKLPAQVLCGAAHARLGRCGDVEGVPTFRLPGPYTRTERAIHVQAELISLLKTLSTQPRSGPRQQAAPTSSGSEASGSSRVLRTAGGSMGHTQRVTAVDLSRRCLRVPTPSKPFFPGSRTRVRINLRGTVMEARYDPRVGPDKQRSATLVFPEAIGRLVGPNEVLSIELGASGIVRLR